jgi:hypothetical protein
VPAHRLARDPAVIGEARPEDQDFGWRTLQQPDEVIAGEAAVATAATMKYMAFHFSLRTSTPRGAARMIRCGSGSRRRYQRQRRERDDPEDGDGSRRRGHAGPVRSISCLWGS